MANEKSIFVGQPAKEKEYNMDVMVLWTKIYKNDEKYYFKDCYIVFSVIVIIFFIGNMCSFYPKALFIPEC